MESLIDQLYAQASEIFERAGDAVDRRDADAHLKCLEEHRMVSAGIRELESGATRQ